jgi:glycosyltransferase involved in cell wall biosynthesis
MFHSVQGWELLSVAKYKRAHPNVRFYVDNHADFNNSARGFVSRNILHKLYYGALLRRAYPDIDAVFYLGEESKRFVQTLYKIPDDKMEFYPLGGKVFTPEERASMRGKRRAELGIKDDGILLCHTGKLDALKRTKDILIALSKVPSDKLKLIIIGSIDEKIKPEIEAMIAVDKRVSFLGWKNADELLEYLCACDLYLQPGSPSATMQNAICCGAPVVLHPYASYEVLMKGNGWFVESAADMERVFAEILENSAVLTQMSGRSLAIAREMLDYKVLAARLYR